MKKFLLIIMIIFMFLSFCVSVAFPSEREIRRIEKGLTLLKSERFREAFQIFNSMMSNDHILNDFLLLWRAEALFGLSRYTEATNDIKLIREEYGDTPALKRARKMEISIMKKYVPEGRDALVALFSEYIRDYPDDYSMQFDYGQYLKGITSTKEAREVFKSLYIQGNDFAVEAGHEFETTALTFDEHIERGGNLLKNWNFSEAEHTFYRALRFSPVDKKEEIHEKIAYCTFKQKQYDRSAQFYSILNDRYMEAVSYLRIGDIENLKKTIEVLKSMRDPRTGALIISLSAGLRRRGFHDEAITLLNENINSYPFSEDMLWEIGWTQYLNGDFRSSERTFQTLFESFESERYFYWMLKSREKYSSSPIEEYKKLCSAGSYYGLLGCVKAGIKIKRVRSSVREARIDSPFLKRYDILRTVGYREEALYELKRLMRNLKKRSDVILYSKKLADMGEYKRAISVATMVPYSDEVHELLYPIAYWDVIQHASERFSINSLYILSIAREESRLDPEARSIAGALGLMQLMPYTAQRISKKIKMSISDRDAVFDVETNIMLGTYYLKMLLDRFESVPIATAAYNAGENAVQRWLNNHSYAEADEFIEDIPYSETKRYVKKVLTTLFQYSRRFSELDYENYTPKILLSFNN